MFHKIQKTDSRIASNIIVGFSPTSYLQTALILLTAKIVTTPKEKIGVFKY